MADGQNPIPGFDINSISKMFGGGALPNFGNMLNGINLNQIMPLVPSIMKMMGGGLGNLGGIFGGNPGVNPGVNPGYINGYNSGYGQVPPANSGFPIGNPAATPFIIPPHLAADPKFLILNTIKPMIPQDKAYIVDQIGRLLVLYITITSLLPKMPAPPPPPIVDDVPKTSSPETFTTLPALSSGA